MKKFILKFLFFFCLLFSTNIMCSMAQSRVVKQGLYTIDDLNLSPDKKYTVQNNSFDSRMYIMIFDSNPNLIQSVRLRPQSKTINLKPLKSEYTILVVGDGELTIS